MPLHIDATVNKDFRRALRERKPISNQNMATFREADDGHFYTLKGYPLTLSGNEETRFTTYTVHGRAEQLFAVTGFRDGQQIPKEMFYALVVEGDITNDFLARHPPTIDSVPRSLQNEVAAYDSFASTGTLLRLPWFKDARYVIEYYRALIAIPNMERKQLLPQACILSLARYLRQFAYDRDVQRNSSKRRND